MCIRDSQMIVLRRDPARARQSAAQHGERLSYVGGNLNTGEEPRHGSLLLFACTARTRDQLLDLRQNTRHDHVDAGGVRVQAVALVQLRIGSYSVEEEWIKDDR